jgi:uncharacterized protein YbjQ (UPF0145 family)
MIITTTDNIPGYRVTKVIGLVKGNTVSTRHLGHDIMAQLKNLVGGEVMEYTKMLAQCREQSLDRMVDEAREEGANAVICTRFVTSEILAGASELLAYGTGVVVEKEE